MRLERKMFINQKFGFEIEDLPLLLPWWWRWWLRWIQLISRDLEICFAFVARLRQRTFHDSIHFGKVTPFVKLGTIFAPYKFCYFKFESSLKFP